MSIIFRFTYEISLGEQSSYLYHRQCGPCLIAAALVSCHFHSFVKLFLVGLFICQELVVQVIMLYIRTIIPIYKKLGQGDA